jgi:exosortase/archaeosortase
MYSMWWANESFKTWAKEYITKTLIWLILLLLSWVILYMVAPWVYTI